MEHFVGLDVSLKLTAFAAGAAICVQSVPLIDRSSTNPVSLFELSVQVRLICVCEIALAAKLLGATGAVGTTTAEVPSRAPAQSAWS